jgi:Transposase IS116/IS110/IS902 family
MIFVQISAPGDPGAKIGRPRPSTTAIPRKFPLHSHSAFKPFARYSDRLLAEHASKCRERTCSASRLVCTWAHGCRNCHCTAVKLSSRSWLRSILSMVLMLEIGRVDRFPTAAHLASYAGLVPRVHSSGGHTRMGQVCGNVNRNLKWAFVETGNLIVINQRRLAGSHVARLYQRIKRSKNHQKAVVAVARHLAEAAWWVLTRQEVASAPTRSGARCWWSEPSAFQWSRATCRSRRR